jgi:hypothetical protein
MPSGGATPAGWEGTIMWKCGACGETVEDSFEVCWNCCRPRDNKDVTTFRRAEDLVTEDAPAGPGPPAPELVSEAAPPEEELLGRAGRLNCAVCGERSLYVRKNVASGTFEGPTLLPGLGGWFSYATFNVVVCATCGHTQFFASEEARRKLSDSGWWKL